MMTFALRAPSPEVPRWACHELESGVLPRVTPPIRASGLRQCASAMLSNKAKFSYSPAVDEAADTVAALPSRETARMLCYCEAGIPAVLRLV
jgi:hypothetical protein